MASSGGFRAQSVQLPAPVLVYDTMTSGCINVYQHPTEAFVIGETTVPAGQVLVEETDIETKESVWRVLQDVEMAKEFIEYRKVDYATMWGSCCYKIDYSAPFVSTSTPVASSDRAEGAQCSRL